MVLNVNQLNPFLSLNVIMTHTHRVFDNDIKRQKKSNLGLDEEEREPYFNLAKLALTIVYLPKMMHE